MSSAETTSVVPTVPRDPSPELASVTTIIRRWVRTNLFGSLRSGVVTLLTIALLVVLVPPLLRWFVTDAVFYGQSRKVCGAGACWAFVTDRFEMFLYGRYPVAERWREHAEQGGGVLFDLGSHLIDQALQLFGRPDWVQADVFIQRAGGTADDGFELLMGQGMRRISIGVSSIAAAGDWRYRVHGSRASFFKSGLDPQEERSRTAGMKPQAEGFGVELAFLDGRDKPQDREQGTNWLLDQLGKVLEREAAGA